MIMWLKWNIHTINISWLFINIYKFINIYWHIVEINSKVTSQDKNLLFVRDESNDHLCMDAWICPTLSCDSTVNMSNLVKKKKMVK